MIRLIVGTKGSGKTKAMIDMINESVRTTKGSVVVVEKGMKLTYDIASAARLIDLDEYKIQGGEMLYGFVAGLMASNYDITDIYIDGILKWCWTRWPPLPATASASPSPSAPTRPCCPTTSRSTCDFYPLPLRGKRTGRCAGGAPALSGQGREKFSCRCAIWGLTQAAFGAILTRQLFRGVLCNLT